MKSFDDMIKKSENMKNEIETVVIKEMNNCATMTVSEAKARCPIKSGALRRSITHEEVKKNNNGYSVKIGSSLSYAQAVEEGHKQEVGRYVPAIGKKLKNPFVQGKHMIHDSITLGQIELNDRVKKAVRSVLDGD